jgi:DNA-binding transcriptional regulator YiaG
MTKEEIRKIRTNAGLTQQAFALALDVAHVTICKWESGERVPGRRSIKDIKAFQEGQK